MIFIHGLHESQDPFAPKTTVSLFRKMNQNPEHIHPLYKRGQARSIPNPSIQHPHKLHKALAFRNPTPTRSQRPARRLRVGGRWRSFGGLGPSPPVLRTWHPSPVPCRRHSWLHRGSLSTTYRMTRVPQFSISKWESLCGCMFGASVARKRQSLKFPFPNSPKRVPSKSRARPTAPNTSEKRDVGMCSNATHLLNPILINSVSSHFPYNHDQMWP